MAPVVEAFLVEGKNLNLGITESVDSDVLALNG